MGAKITVSCPAREWVIHDLSKLPLDEIYSLPEFVVDAVTWFIYVQPSCDSAIPKVALCRSKELFTESTPVRARFVITIVNQDTSDNTVCLESEKLFGDAYWACEYCIPVETAPIPVGFIVDDTLVLKCHVRVLEDVSLGSVSRALRERSEEFLTRSCMRLFKGKDTLEPDVILKLGDVMLPAHRALLAKSSNYFNELFQSGKPESNSTTVEIQDVAAADMQIILNFFYGVLEHLPEERLQSLLLATKLLQVPELMTPCVSQLKLCLTEDTFGEIAILGDKTNHEGLRDACMDFAMQKENRGELVKHKSLKRALTDAPDFALKLVTDLMKQGVLESAGTD